MGLVGRGDGGEGKGGLVVFPGGFFLPGGLSCKECVAYIFMAWGDCQAATTTQPTTGYGTGQAGSAYGSTQTATGYASQPASGYASQQTGGYAGTQGQATTGYNQGTGATCFASKISLDQKNHKETHLFGSPTFRLVVLLDSRSTLDWCLLSHFRSSKFRASSYLPQLSSKLLP